ncbi:MAG: c-type cytochrome [Hydrogenophilales bacterium]|nr:c-type cytochrome [Hydrogenophilales bacterium]
MAVRSVRQHLLWAGLVLLGLNLPGSVLAATGSAAGDIAIGAKLAQYCAYCHGADGNAVHAGTPRLAGQDAEAFIAKMKGYKSNTRLYHPGMGFLVLGLDEKGIRDLAAFYASQPVKVSEPYVGPAALK